MQIIKTDSPSQEALQLLEALRQAVRRDLERKWRLGQYAVFCEDGKIVKKSGDELKKLFSEE